MSTEQKKNAESGSSAVLPIDRPDDDDVLLSVTVTERMEDDGSGSSTVLQNELIGLTMKMMMTFRYRQRSG